MTTANATHPGRVCIPGTDIGVKGTLVAEPQTENMLLSLDDRLALGPVKVDTNPSGTLESPGLVVPIVSGVLWLLRFEPHRHDVPPFTLGVYNLNTSGVDLKDLVEAVPIAIDETVALNIEAAAALGATNDTATASFLNNPASSSRSAAQGLLPVRKLDDFIPSPSSDNSTQINAAFTAARAGGFQLRATAGTTYFGKNLDPTGTTVDWRGATLKHPTGGTGAGMFVPTNGFTTIGGTFDGTRAGVTAPANNLHSAVYLENAAGWSTPIRMTSPTFKDWHHRGVYAVGDRTILDAATAPWGAVILDRPVATNCGAAGFYFLGIEGVDLDAPRAIGCGYSGIYSHRTFRMRAWDVFVSGTVDSHGYTSVHSVEDAVSGESSDNVNGGFVWGGADASGTYLPGRRHRIGKIVAKRNGVGTGWAGVTFDPTISGSSGIAQQIDAKIEQVISTDNGAAGLQFSQAKDVFVGSATCDNNGGHGISLTAQKVTILAATCRNNTQSAITEFGSTSQYGGHVYGTIDGSGNSGASNGVFIGSGADSRIPSRWIGNPGVQTITSTATLTVDASTVGRVKITAQAAGSTIANPTGAPGPMQSLIVRLKDNGTARGISYGTQFRGIGVTLPTTTVANKTVYLGFMWNVDATKWDCIAVGQE